MEGKKFWSTQELARRWYVRDGTLRMRRTEKKPPEYIKENNLILYPHENVIAYEKKILNYIYTKSEGEDISLLDTKALAKRWHMSVMNVATWRRKNLGPKFTQIEGKPFYNLRDIMSYEKEESVYFQYP